MKNQKIKLIYIANATKKTHSAVSQWLNGVTTPSISDIKIMDEKFGIPPTAWYDIFSYIDNNSERFGAIKRLRRQHNGNTKV
ncbi:helix-turn-helix domain-containing protein [Campylobacter gastrosuis]|uniref:helix-turn-helix domain-containing protein n=1 Tax=Campylobacter gastrosuis TaxID=2974576 RepID=UPI003D76CC9B